MNLEQLHQYLGELIEAGTERKLPVLLPGANAEEQPQELTNAMLINGSYHADPAPLMVGFHQRTGAGLLLSGLTFDMDTLNNSHVSAWPPVEPPVPERSFCVLENAGRSKILKIDPSLQQSITLDPLEASRAEPDFIVQFLEQLVGVKLNAEKKASILNVVSKLPEGAGMRDLYEAIMVKEAASLGVTVEQYEALSPVLEALQGALKQVDHATLFQQPADL